MLLIARVNRILLIIELEIDAESYLIFKSALLQTAALLFDDEP